MRTFTYHHVTPALVIHMHLHACISRSSSACPPLQLLHHRPLPPQAHGWTQKGDDKDPAVAAAAADAFKAAAEFFRDRLVSA